jgi:hypothetical protein
MTGPSPVDRGKSGSKIHVLSDRAGIPLAVAISAANTNDAEALRPLVAAIPAVRSRSGPRMRRPGKLHADKAMTTPNCASGFETGASASGSHARASNPAPASVGTVGSLSERSPGRTRRDATVWAAAFPGLPRIPTFGSWQTLWTWHRRRAR